MYYTSIDAPRGVKILEDIIEGFDKRFGDGTHITELREDHTPNDHIEFLYCLGCFKGLVGQP